MFIKLTLICLMIVPLIFGEDSENPAEGATTRVGKFFGLFAVYNNNNAGPLKLFISANKRWKGELSLSFGRRPLIASGITAEYQQHLEFPTKQLNFPSGSLQNLLQQFDDPPTNNFPPSNATSTSGIDVETTEATTLDSTTETMQAASRTLKLEDYDEITFDPNVDGNRVSREAILSDPNGNNRGLRADNVDGAGDLTTTVESSTMTMKFQDLESNFVTMSPPPSSQGSYSEPQLGYLPYPPSSNPTAQHVTITTSPLHPPYLPPVKNYYDFYPSQLDSYRQPMPYCINSVHHKFTPAVHDTWSIYRKWK